MIPTRLRGISFAFIFLMVSCKESRIHLPISRVSQENFSSIFPEYCQMDSSTNFQYNSYLCSFVGDYEGALHYATKDAVSRRTEHSMTKLSKDDIEAAKVQLHQLIMDSANQTEETQAMKKLLLSIINEGENLNDAFRGKVQTDAKKYIIEQSERYHFVLINEAHHSSQNRKFTMDLLRPLWEKGFRYLALETLAYQDDSLMLRGYPRMNTGYYTKDPVFGNLLREALSIGYSIVPYEAKNDLLSDATSRDKEQAQNIFNSTWMKDSIGKVLVHAGYSHISEFASPSYEPMGFNLRQLVRRPILTIDQKSMSELDSDEVLNPYYLHALNHFNFSDPVVFLNDDGMPLVEPLNAAGIDVQVYLPRTVIIQGRPSWLISGEYKIYDFPSEALSFTGDLLEILREEDDPLAVPVDAIVIEPGKALVLKPGNYTLQIIDRAGTLVGKAQMNVPD